MKKALIKLFVFTLLFYFIDLLWGVSFNYMQSHSKGDKPYYIAENAIEDVIVFGSSKGGSNYNLEILRDSLKLSCYNCSDPGNGIIMMYGLYKMLTQRYNPKIIIYDVHPTFDLYKNDNSKYTMRIKSFYEKPIIAAIIRDTDSHEKYKMMSFLYRYNFRFLEVIQSYKAQKVSSPVLSKKIMTIIPEKKIPQTEIEYDSLKLAFFEEMMKDANKRHIQLFFTVSPEFFNINMNRHNPLIDLCKKYDFPYFDFSDNKDFVENANYFQDSVHMNYFGASTYTNRLIHLIKSH